MGNEKRGVGRDVSPVLVAVGAGTIGVWLWWRGKCREPLRTSDTMAGRVCVVTGANAGIGKATATALAQEGAHVVLACRSPSKCFAACEDIRRKVPGATVQTLPLDLESVSSIRGFVRLFRQTRLPLHVLINNAGIVTGKPETVRGMEKNAVVNHLGPFLLTNLLLPDLRKGALTRAAGGSRHDPARSSEELPASRIINVASRLEKRGILAAAEDPAVEPGPGWFQPPPGPHKPFDVYATSKLCNMLFTFELDRRLSAGNPSPLKGDGGQVTVNAVSPGVVNTALGDSTVSSPWIRWAAAPVKALFMRTVEKGAETVVWAATSPEVEKKGGKFFGDLKEVPCSDSSKDSDLAERLWRASEIAAGLDEDERAV